MPSACGRCCWRGSKRGEVVALVSDAGTPLVSDPGFKLVQAAVAAGLPVTTLPGASAALAALVLSGLPSDQFLFADSCRRRRWRGGAPSPSSRR